MWQKCFLSSFSHVLHFNVITCVFMCFCRFLAFWTWSCGQVTAGSFTRRLRSTRFLPPPPPCRKAEPRDPNHVVGVPQHSHAPLKKSLMSHTDAEKSPQWNTGLYQPPPALACQDPQLTSTGGSSQQGPSTFVLEIQHCSSCCMLPETVALQSAVFVKPCITAGWLHTDSRSFSGHTVFVSLQYYYTTLCFKCLHVTLVTLFMFDSDFSLCSSSVITAHWLLFVLLMLNLCWCQRRKSRDRNMFCLIHSYHWGELVLVQHWHTHLMNWFH